MEKRLKKFAGILLFVTMFMGSGSISLASSFPDVNPGEWYYDTVKWAANHELITGYENGNFGPNDNLERGHFVTILYRMAGSPEQSFEAGVYSDVEDGWFYSVPAVWAKNTGVISGYDDGRFGPTDNVTREQAATILYRYANLLGADTSITGEVDVYPDGSRVSGFARKGVRFAIGAGLIRGDRGYINPVGNASRAQIAAILQRFLSYVEREEAANISNVDSKYTIEADVKLTGSGTGYHAKLVVCTPTSAISFGIQYDRWGEAPYTDKTVFLIENVRSNDKGGQTYPRTGYALCDKTYHLMLAIQDNGGCDVFVNGVCVGSVINPELANKKLYLRVEGSGRKNGDSVHAEFSNIKLKGSGIYLPDKIWGTYNFDTNKGMYSDVSRYDSDKTIVIDGSIVGLSAEEDWDSTYEGVSGIIQFIE